jgi:hypothetical protein
MQLQDLWQTSSSLYSVIFLTYLLSKIISLVTKNPKQRRYVRPPLDMRIESVPSFSTLILSSQFLLIFRSFRFPSGFLPEFLHVFLILHILSAYSPYCNIVI